MTDPPNPTALLAWAHSSPGWSSERTAAWRDEVLRFVRALRSYGIDVDLDLHHASEPGVDWTRFGPNAVIDRDWVIVALSRAWRERFEGRNDPTVGAGAAAEADALLSIYQSQGQDALRTKTVLVRLPSMIAEDVVPTGLHGLHRFDVRDFSLTALEDLIRLLTGQPKHPAESLGSVPDLPPALSTEPALSATPDDAVPVGAPPAPPEADIRKLTAATQRLVQALDDHDSNVRFEAMSALGDRLTPDLLPVIEPLLTDHDDYIRQYAVEYYANLTGREGTPQLVEALRDRDSSVRFAAMSALGERLAPDLLPVLEPLLKDHDNYIRQYAVEYYANLTGREGTPQLVAALRDHDSSVRFAAMSALGDRLGPELLPVIEPLLRDPDNYIRQYAVEYYARLQA